MNQDLKPILVTGSHRSGTTWVGKILSTAPNTAYIHEPFNPNTKISRNPEEFDVWYKYISDENAYNFKQSFSKIVNYQYPLIFNITKIKTIRNIAKIVRDQSLSYLYKIKNDTPIVKDPIAFFSTEWLAKYFNMNVLVMIRHPAAFCSSLKIKRWSFDFNNFLNQPLLIDHYLYPYRDQIYKFAKTKKNLIDQAILLWNCIHHTVIMYKSQNENWIFLRHEDLSTDPLSQFYMIYNKFNLTFTNKVRSEILRSTSSQNPAEQHSGKNYFRNSKSNIYNWKIRLSQNEIEYIKENTIGQWKLFYSDNEW